MCFYFFEWIFPPTILLVFLTVSIHVFSCDFFRGKYATMHLQPYNADFFFTILSCDSLWPTEVSGLPARLAPGKHEEQRARRGFRSLVLQAPQQGPHLSLQCHQPHRQHQVPGPQRASQTEQGWTNTLTRVALSSFGIRLWLSSSPLSTCSDRSLPEDRRQIRHDQL